MQIVITLELYGVKNIIGIQYGYRGFFDQDLPEIEVRAFFCKEVISAVVAPYNVVTGVQHCSYRWCW